MKPQNAYQHSFKPTSPYHPFGMIMSERGFSSPNYRYGYQGSEKDDEISGNGNSYSTEFRELNTRGGLWWSIDPIIKEWESPFSGFHSNPIVYNDEDGADPTVIHLQEIGKPSVSKMPNEEARPPGLHARYKLFVKKNRGIIGINRGRHGNNLPRKFSLNRWEHTINTSVGPLRQYQLINRARGSRIKIANNSNVNISIFHDGRTIVLKPGKIYRDRIRASILERNSESGNYTVTVPVGALGRANVDVWNWREVTYSKFSGSKIKRSTGVDLDSYSIKDGFINLGNWLNNLIN